MFPQDFFEHCQATSEIEFGGNDVLQVYNVAQVKHRLTTAGKFIACTKVLFSFKSVTVFYLLYSQPSGFTLEITNTNSSNVMVGLQVQVGGQALERVPSYLEVFGRSTQV
jgi:E3 ubiquitin-protein ligase UBR4